MVDLSANDGFGECSCKRWQCHVWPKIRDKLGEPATATTTCAHVRAALGFFLREVLKAWIRQHGQDRG
ncbi:hypothetical protein [Thiocapsa sp. N5-Cardenillas]|uniref:hypothetical protein n=1 Tax=Thiocapsa sp. N5-Cardenillas TaxID=3137397 RepID=UPI0035B2EA94